MSLTQAPTAPSRVAPSAASTKVAALAAALLAVSLFMTVAVIDVPHHASDHELLSWWSGLREPLGGRDVRPVGTAASRSRSPWS